MITRFSHNRYGLTMSGRFDYSALKQYRHKLIERGRRNRDYWMLSSFTLPVLDFKVTGSLNNTADWRWYENNLIRGRNRLLDTVACFTPVFVHVHDSVEGDPKLLDMALVLYPEGTNKTDNWRLIVNLSMLRICERPKDLLYRCTIS